MKQRIVFILQPSSFRRGMPAPVPASWSDPLRRTLACYDEPLLREVAGRLIKPRNQWPVDDLIERMLDATANPAVVDRRLRELETAGRQALALIGHSRQPAWALGNLVEMLMALGHADGLKPLFDLLSAGLLYPSLSAGARVRSFEQWLAHPGSGGLTVFTLPAIATRAVGEDLGLPDLTAPEPDEIGSAGGPAGAPGTPGRAGPTQAREADGLEWLLRLGVLWQQVSAAPLRRTMQGGFFKRDQERLEQDPLLNSPPADRTVDVPDLGFLIASLAELAGVVREADGELRAGALPAAWESGLASALEALWASLPQLRAWNALDGWRGEGEATGNPFASASLLSLLLLARLPEQTCVGVDVVQAWIGSHHPYWAGDSLRPSRQRPWLDTFLLGLAYHLRLVQVCPQAEGATLVRLAPMGRWLLGLADAPPAEGLYARTLLVQPNLEILAYRQGLTANLVARLTRFATWKNLGPACTLQLEPETVYRALESGESFESIRLALDQHGTRATPPAVLDLLRTWADKRDRITVYPSATLLEFASAADLSEALARGLPAQRVADTLAVVASEDAIEFRHFRLTGTRDYALPPERCVSLEPDGVTLSVDLARSDLLLETELPRFAELLEQAPAGGRRLYRLTPASLANAREAGIGPNTLEAWFQQRVGQPLSAAARLLLTGAQTPSPQLRRHLVLHLASEELADGLLQWPQTRGLIADRLGPTALVVTEEHLPLLRERLGTAGIELDNADGE
jgi:hypothetical protein